MAVSCLPGRDLPPPEAAVSTPARGVAEVSRRPGSFDFGYAHDKHGVGAEAVRHQIN